MEFPGKKKSSDSKRGGGTSFLAEAKHNHQALFIKFLEQAEEYEEFEQFIGDLESAAWKFTEALAKASWKNGVIRGEQRRS